MRNLLRANFSRLWKSKALWLCAAGAFAFSAAFLSLFLGVEYQDGTLRNKIIAGHARWKVYAASLLSGAAGCWVVLLGWLLSIPIGC